MIAQGLCIVIAVAFPGAVIALIDAQLTRQARHDVSADCADEQDGTVGDLPHLPSGLLNKSPFHNQWSN